ncbi:MAG: glutaminyl-peptide cyclotransferase [Flavobacteriaceae bacterium]|nr:glutaminyl-peptide cyclotransferase [Flavobacteriaceae bacterium]
MSAKLLYLLSLLLLISIGCEPDQNQRKSDFSLKTTAKKDVFVKGSPIEFELVNKKNKTIESVKFQLSGSPIENGQVPEKIKLGKQELTAIVKYESGTDTISRTLTIVNDSNPKIYKYRLLNTYPHDITSYTQGLEFHDGFLYESTGQNGESKLRKIDYKTGEVIKNIELDKVYFGEGLTVFNNKVYQLTWRNKTGFIYDLPEMNKTGSFRYGESQEGWGLCHDNSVLYKSDGTEKIWRLNPETLSEMDYIQAYTNKGKIIGLNELEWVEGKIFANRYQKNGVAIINPGSGAIEGVIDFSPLRKEVKQHPKLDVLNGIAYNPDTGTIFVTGKNWDKLFEVEIIED